MLDLCKISQKFPANHHLPSRLSQLAFPARSFRLKSYDLPAQASARRIAQTLHIHIPTWRQTGTDLEQTNRDRPPPNRDTPNRDRPPPKNQGLSPIFPHFHRLLRVDEAPKCDAAPISFLPKKIKIFQKKTRILVKIVTFRIHYICMINSNKSIFERVDPRILEQIKAFRLMDV